MSLKNETPDQKRARLAAVKATKAADKAKRDAQTIVIDDQWSIIRFDELNWAVQKKGEVRPRGYYGNRLVSAFNALAVQMLSDEAKTSLAHVCESQNALYAKIEEALMAAASKVTP